MLHLIAIKDYYKGYIGLTNKICQIYFWRSPGRRWEPH